jgi:hypothetical protein
MRKYPLTAMSFLLLLCFVPTAIAQSTLKTTKEENIRKLLVLMDSSGTFMRALEEQLSLMKARVTQIPPRFWDEVLKEVDPDKFVELLIPVYDKHFSDEDLKGLIAFYETPLGKKWVSELPQLMPETAAIGVKYGEQISNRVIKRMQAEGTFPSAAPAGDGKPLPPRR